MLQSGCNGYGSGCLAEIYVLGEVVLHFNSVFAQSAVSAMVYSSALVLNPTSIILKFRPHFKWASSVLIPATSTVGIFRLVRTGSAPDWPENVE